MKKILIVLLFVLSLSGCGLNSVKKSKNESYAEFMKDNYVLIPSFHSYYTIDNKDIIIGKDDLVYTVIRKKGVESISNNIKEVSVPSLKIKLDYSLESIEANDYELEVFNFGSIIDADINDMLIEFEDGSKLNVNFGEYKNKNLKIKMGDGKTQEKLGLNFVNDYDKVGLYEGMGNFSDRPDIFIYSNDPQKIEDVIYDKEMIYIGDIPKKTINKEDYNVSNYGFEDTFGFSNNNYFGSSNTSFDLLIKIKDNYYGTRYNKKIDFIVEEEFVRLSFENHQNKVFEVVKYSYSFH